MRSLILTIALLASACCFAQNRMMPTTVVPAANLTKQTLSGELTLGNDGLLYAAISDGGAFGQGRIIKTTVDGAVTTVVSFDGTNGAIPVRMPVQAAGGCFYGVTEQGGSMGLGTVYRIDSNGILSAIYSFDLTNGSSPTDLIMGKDGNLYGVTRFGGVGSSGSSSSGCGVVFKVTTNSVYTRLADFVESNDFPVNIVEAGDGNFYGITHQGGSYGAGTVFRMNSGHQLETLMTFTQTNGNYPMSLTLGSDGCLYGTTGSGGNDFDGDFDGWGSVFKVTTNGEFTNLWLFSFTEGAWPYGRLLEVSNGVFYGTTYLGGYSGVGTIFRLTSDGQFEDIIQFDQTHGRSSAPWGGLTKGADGNYYGCLSAGSSGGEIFCLRPIGVPVMLQPTFQDGQINLRWHAWGGCPYDLEYKSDLNEPDWRYLVETGVPTNSIISFPDSVGDRRFYRVVLGIPEHLW